MKILVINPSDSLCQLAPQAARKKSNVRLKIHLLVSKFAEAAGFIAQENTLVQAFDLLLTLYIVET